VSDFDRLSADMDKAATDVVKRGRGVTAKHVDQMAAAAKANALSSWTKYGRGAAGSAGTIRGRMSSDRSEIVGYVFASGEGAFQAEHGTSNRAPDPVLGQATEAGTGAWIEGLNDLLGDLL